jgi:hypothetical protein
MKQNACKWVAMVEIERMSCDPDWLDKAVRIVEKQGQGTIGDASRPMMVTPSRRAETIEAVGIIRPLRIAEINAAVGHKAGL